MEEPADRLRQATKWAGRSIRSVQQELHAEGVPGSSYSNVHAYFGGQTPPTIEFLRAAADVLEVRAAWLAFGDGPPTDEMQEAAERLGAAVERSKEKITAIVREKLGARVHGREVGAITSATLRFAVATGRGDETPAETDLWVDFAEAIAAPVRTLGIDPAELPAARYAHYIRTVAEAIAYLTETEATHG